MSQARSGWSGWWALGAVLLVGGCAGARENAELPPVPRWSLATAADLEIRDDGEPGHDLFQVRAATSLPDGGLLVLNGGSFEVRRFDRGGRLVATIGRPGEGPGEFRAPLALQRLGDTVAVYDLILRRLSHFDLDGGLLGELSFTEEPWATPGVGLQVVPNGDLLAIDLAGSAPIDPVTHLRRMPYAVVRYLADRGVVDSLGEGPGAAFVIEASDRGERAWAQPFGATTAAAASAIHTFIGGSEAYRIRVLDRDGIQQAEIHDPRPTRPVTDDLVRAVVDWRVALGSASDAAATRAALEGAALPTTVPAFGELLVDDEGLLWVAPYWLPGEATRTWQVWDATGTRRAEVEVPADLRLLAVGREALVATGTDEAGAEFVVRLPLDRRGGADH